MKVTDFIFTGWHAPLRVLLVGTLAYFTLLLLLRISGKRTLSKMNAFDFIVTIALGSTLASALLSRDVALVQAAVAFSLLIALQFVVTWLSVRSATVGNLVKSQPTLLLYRGQFLRQAMRRERVSEHEVVAAIREHGGLTIEDVAAVVLETSGEMSVMNNDHSERPDSTLSHVSNVTSDRDAQRQVVRDGNGRKNP